MASYSGDGGDSSAHDLSEFTFAQRRFLIDDEPLARDFPLAICRLMKFKKKCSRIQMLARWKFLIE
jgi:hypothetical protein